MSSLGPSWRHLCPIQTLQLPAKRPLQAQGEGVGGGVNPSPKGKKGVKEEGLPKPLTPKGLVGFQKLEKIKHGKIKPNLDSIFFYFLNIENVWKEMRIVTLFRERNQNSSFAVLSALQKRKNRNKITLHINNK